MGNIVRTAENEIIRNEILKMCDMAGSQGASEQVLRVGLRKLGIHLEPEEVEKQVKYLEGKHFVEVTRVGNDRLGIHRSIVSLTALGTDVLEGNAEANGIDTD